MQDKVGNEITVGSFIAYAHLLSRSAALQFGRVEVVNEDKDTITVLGVEDGYGEDLEETKPSVLLKRSTLLYPKRTLIVPNIPQKYLDALSKDCLGQGKKTHTWELEDEYSRRCSVCGRSRY
jgi:hypothetical protein